MIYYATVRHNRRTYEPEFLYPDTHPYESPLFKSRPLRLPEEQFHYDSSMNESESGNLQDPSDFPKWIKFKTPEKEAQDFYRHSGRWTIVSQLIMDKIESLDPGVHQFIAVKLLQKDGSEPWGKYYYFNMRRYVFSVDVEKSPHFGWRSESLASGRHLHQLIFSPKSELAPSEMPHKNGKTPLLVYKSSIVSTFSIWRERLNFNDLPNNATMAWVGEGGDKRLVIINEEKPSKISIYSFKMPIDASGFWVSTAFKAWLDEVGAKGLEYSSPGCLDTELKGA